MIFKLRQLKLCFAHATVAKVGKGGMFECGPTTLSLGKPR